ncbi:MAG: DUF4239 domain-containing protein [Gammaproteobacteria bacterium]
MLNYLSQLHDIALFLILSGFFIAISVISVPIVQKFIPLDLRYKYNSVVGNISALIGVIYSVLVGLTALYLFNNNSYTANAVQHEASALANVYRDSQWLQEPTKSKVDTAINQYLNEIIHTEWPTMQAGRDLDQTGEHIIDSISNDVILYIQQHPKELLIERDMLDEIKSLYNSREQRIHMSYAALTSEIWEVILIGTFLTIAINFLYRMNIKLHIIIIIPTALMVSSMLFLLVTLDRPFQGEFIIGTDAFQSILTHINDKRVNPLMRV